VGADPTLLVGPVVLFAGPLLLAARFCPVVSVADSSASAADRSVLGLALWLPFWLSGALAESAAVLDEPAAVLSSAQTTAGQKVTLSAIAAATPTR
jgi:hypothetical protein